MKLVGCFHLEIFFSVQVKQLGIPRKKIGHQSETAKGKFSFLHRRPVVVVRGRTIGQKGFWNAHGKGRCSRCNVFVEGAGHVSVGQQGCFSLKSGPVKMCGVTHTRVLSG